MDIDIKRVYEKAGVTDGCRVLVDRLWPRGLSKDKARIDYWAKEIAPSTDFKARIDYWAKEIAPSTELRKKFAHDTDRWEDFKKNYHQELRNNVSGWNDFLQNISHCAKLTLLYGAHDTEHNNAAVLREYLKKKI